MGDIHAVQMADRVISFDGQVLELFQTRGESLRFHVLMISKIEINERRRGYEIALDYTRHNMPERIGFTEDVFAQIEALVIAVKDAMHQQ